MFSKPNEMHKKNKQEFFALVDAQGKELMEIFELYGNCKYCEHSLCCKISTPILLEYDISKIAEYLKISNEEFLKQYIHEYEIQELNGVFEKNYVLNQIPCPFLNKMNKCTIYPVRPLSCKCNPFQPGVMNICLEAIDICPTAALIASDVWEYQQILRKGFSEDDIKRFEKEYLEELKGRKEFEDKYMNPLENFHDNLGISDITSQVYNETYRTVDFLEAMTYHNRY